LPGTAGVFSFFEVMISRVLKGDCYQAAEYGVILLIGSGGLMTANKIRILIFSKQALLRQGLEETFSHEDGAEILPAAEISDYLLSLMSKNPPDVAIVDIDASDGSGMSITQKLIQFMPSIGIIALTSDDNDVRLFEVLKAQAAACLNKETGAERIVDVVRRVARGEHPINDDLINHPILADQVLIQFHELSRHTETQPLVSPLTLKEKEILNYIAQGLINREIAGLLNISERSIKNQVTSILRKLNANARTEAVVVAVKRGIISIK
jgi:DNA-binding NarL/FixJ family response regulator